MTQEELKVNEPQETTEEPIDLDPKKFKNDSMTGKYRKPNLNGKVVTIGQVSVKANPMTKQTQKSQKPFRDVYLQLPYTAENLENVHENYGGLRQYMNEEGEWMPPVLAVPTGDSAAAVLLRTWGMQVKKLKHREEYDSVSLAEFVNSLSGAKVKLEHQEGSIGGNKWEKNVVKEFVEGGEQ